MGIMVILAIMVAIFFSVPTEARAEQLGIYEKTEGVVIDNSGREMAKLERFTLEIRGRFVLGSVVSATALDNFLTESLSGQLIGTVDNAGGITIVILWDNAPREEREFSLSYDKETLTPIRGGCFITHENDCVVAGDGDYDRVPNN